MSEGLVQSCFLKAGGLALYYSCIRPFFLRQQFLANESTFMFAGRPIARPQCKLKPD